MKSLTTSFRREAKAKTIIGLVVLCALVVFVSAAQVYAATMPPEVLEAIKAKYPDGLPAYLTPEEQQWLDEQAAIEALQAPTMELLEAPEIGPLYVQPPGATAPPSGTIWTPAEWEPLAGVLIAWDGYTPLLTTFAVEVSQPDTNAKVYVVVDDTSERTSVTSSLTSAGANMSNVEFIVRATDTVWIRDYGPRYFYNNSSHAIMDHTYNRPRANDNALPAYLASYWSDPYFDFGLTHGGGNFHCFSDGNAFSSSLILEENLAYTADDINDIMRDYFNVNETIFPRLSSSVDATGHLDMWFMPLGPNKVLISQFSSNTYGQQTTTNNAAAVLQARGYTVYRTPAWNSGSTHYTYTNAAIVNNKVFIPSYSGYSSQNTTAYNQYVAAMPGYEIIPVDCTSIIPAAGAIHCVMKHVYAPTTPVPIVEVVSPDGGERWEVGTQQQIQWVATDDVSVTSIDLYYSTNAGSTWNTIATGLSNTGTYDWTVPSTLSTQCRVRVVAHDGAANTGQDISEADFSIALPLPPAVVYDYSGITNPSSSHKAEDGEIDVTDSVIQNGTFGARRDTIAGWALWAEATTAEYAALVSSDDSRYSTADPGSGDNAAMIFELYVDENSADVERIDISVEIGRGASTDLGYAYLWNYSTNSYLVLGTQSGTADGVVSASITSNPGDYINPTTGQVTVFVVNMDDSDVIRVDRILVTIYAQPSLPGQATNPNPTSGATNVGLTPTLSWTAGTGAASHIVYFGTDSTPDSSELIGNQQMPDVDYAPGTLSTNKTYYWRIDANNVGGTTTGDVWSFATNAQVPDVVNMTEAAATTAITDAGLVKGTVTQECSDTVAAGLVISQTPTGGTQVDVGSSVDLVISTGQPSVPSVVGSTEADAIAAINAVANISYGSSTTECSDAVAAGSVISQSATGTVACGTVVNLVVSSGPCLQTISGYVTEPDANIPVEGVLVDANNNGGGTDTTDADGYYEVVVPYNWSGTATPIKEGYAFEPNSILYNNVVADEVNDYTATLLTFVISGYITESDEITPISDVNVSAENGGGPWTSRYGGGSDITDATGYYEVVVDYKWSGKVTPAKYAYAFEPNGRNYTDVNEDWTTNQGYTGTLLTYRITGYIKNECNDVPIEGVLVNANNGGGQNTTDVNGFYEVWVDYAWSGTVTPTKKHYTFDLNWMNYVDVLADHADQNYAADNIYDLDCDGSIGLGDVDVMASNWLSSDPEIPCDFVVDGTVNFLDFAEFGIVWEDR